MRESNFAFPAQNRACVCITSQLYDRRALDTTSPLPLFNSLTQLVYLTSTSPRIREIMTMDGGLERLVLVRILHDFCICPPPPENPAMLYGLSPPTARPNKLVPTLNPPSFDKHAAYRFSLAFQCLVNIGRRGLRTRDLRLGPARVLLVCPKETREQRQARRMLQNEQRQRQDVDALYRALIRQQMEQQAEGRSAEPEPLPSFNGHPSRPRPLLHIPSHPLRLNVTPSHPLRSTGTPVARGHFCTYPATPIVSTGIPVARSARCTHTAEDAAPSYAQASP
ncbi:hypothetical protein PC9H_009188 [Pleurotus ostreatus]|uniref:Uncharacterized protein n=1 Tax=Pleurotus ostreatus TaxID=5322 RepID=A0A8H6ZT21_PLEOS|nr:uncharacterized protein PC9H_009188 [Pleurotus ostreatus]KAF7426819.1 hypothetical protein PC9H_009188 [Pleurotus ostreatus]